MAENEIRVGDVGTIFRLQVMEKSPETEEEEVVDLSYVVGKYIIFKKPNGETVTVEAEFTTDGKDGRIQYVVPEQEGGFFLDRQGRWEIQGRIVTGTGAWKTSIASFWVHRNLS